MPAKMQKSFSCFFLRFFVFRVKIPLFEKLPQIPSESPAEERLASAKTDLGASDFCFRHFRQPNANLKNSDLLIHETVLLLLYSLLAFLSSCLLHLLFAKFCIHLFFHRGMRDINGKKAQILQYFSIFFSKSYCVPENFVI